MIDAIMRSPPRRRHVLTPSCPAPGPLNSGKVQNEFVNPESDLRTKYLPKAGISVRNDTDVPLLVICSQLTPLHVSAPSPFPPRRY